MAKYTFARYFIEQVLRKRPYLEKSWCIQVAEDPIKVEYQLNGRKHCWGRIAAADGRILRVVLLEDGYTILNAFFDRGFKDEA